MRCTEGCWISSINVDIDQEWRPDKLMVQRPSRVFMSDAVPLTSCIPPSETLADEQLSYVHTTCNRTDNVLTYLLSILTILNSKVMYTRRVISVLLYPNQLLIYEFVRCFGSHAVQKFVSKGLCGKRKTI